MTLQIDVGVVHEGIAVDFWGVVGVGVGDGDGEGEGGPDVHAIVGCDV